MSVSQVKNQMYILSNEITNINNKLNNLISTLDSLTDDTINSIINSSNNIKPNINILNNSLNSLYRMTSVELHILFSNYNKSLVEIKKDIGDLTTILEVILINSKAIYYLYVVERFLEYEILYPELRIDDIKKYSSRIRNIRNRLTRLNEKTITNNNKLVIKNNRGWRYEG